MNSRMNINLSPPAQNGELDDQVKEESSKALEKDNKMKYKKN